MMRISMSLPKKLLNEFDEVLRGREYQSRSKGIRDALKDYIVRYQWMGEMEGERMGIISIIYEPHQTDVLEDLRDIRYDYRDYIKAVMYLHPSEKYILEVNIVKGDVNHIRNLTEEIMKLKGVEHVRLTSIASGENIEVKGEERL